LIGPNGGVLLGTVPAGLVSFVPYQATVTGSRTTPATKTVYTAPSHGSGSWPSKYYTWRSTPTTGGTLSESNITFTYNGSGTYATSGGSSSYSGGSTGSAFDDTTHYQTAQDALNASPGAGQATVYTPTGTPSTSVSESTAAVTSGMYDQRQLTGINLMQIDMSALRAALNDTNTGTLDSNAITDASGTAVWGSGTTGGYNPIVANSTGWNGAVYVQVKTSTGSTTQTSIALGNGKVASGSSLAPAVNTVAGLTVATNAPMYVLGNFNADGTVSTSSSTTPDDGKTDAIGTPTSAEVPVALAADAITILSPNYFATAGTNGSSVSVTNTDNTKNAYNSWKTESPTATTTYTEVAAAFITGLVPTSAGASSGGAHNLPRFLENFGSKTVAIRGSLVSMYKSKVATGSWSTRYYSPPTRNWGFDVIFQNGHFPPMTPKVMSYRRVDFSDLSLNDAVRSGVTIKGYNTLRHELWPSSF
jgi:hypothetical protein